MYRCESWTIKKAECQRINAFELWYWRRLLRAPWTARRSNQFILKENLLCNLNKNGRLGPPPTPLICALPFLPISFSQALLVPAWVTAVAS